MLKESRSAMLLSEKVDIRAKKIGRHYTTIAGQSTKKIMYASNNIRANYVSQTTEKRRRQPHNYSWRFLVLSFNKG